MARSGFRGDWTDGELLEGIEGGDGLSFDAFYQRRLPVVVALLLRETRDREAAADLAAEVFAAVMLAAGRRIEDEADEGSASALLDSLPEHEREAIRRRVLDEQSCDHIAGELRCSEMVVRKRVSRGWLVCATGPRRTGKSMFDAQQIAAYAAGEQHRFWDYALLFLAEQRAGSGYATSAYLEGLARQLPALNLTRWQTMRGTPALLARVRSDATIAHTDRVIATPTLVVAGANAHVTLVGDATYRQVVSAIDRVRRVPAVAGNAVVKECLLTGHVSRHYAKAQLRGALKSMSGSVKQYTNCQNVISRALASIR